MKYCVLDGEKLCDECGACDRCDLDPNKICDNCCKCIQQPEEDYAKISVLDVVMEQPEAYLAALHAQDIEPGIGDATLYLEEVEPALQAEWEKKLRALEAREEAQKGKIPGAGLHGTRKKRE